MTNLPTPYAAARIAAFLSGHLCWSACWDKKDGVWRVFQDDPDSDLYGESRDAATVIRYMTSHSLGRHGRGHSAASQATSWSAARPRT